MKDKTLKCKRCGNEFVWSREEQKLYKERNLSEPLHCPICQGMMEAEKKYYEQRRKNE